MHRMTSPPFLPATANVGATSFNADPLALTVIASLLRPSTRTPHFHLQRATGVSLARRRQENTREMQGLGAICAGQQANQEIEETRFERARF